MSSAILLHFASLVPMADPDPLGYPSPPWVLQALSYLTLTLHLFAVQFTLGSAILYLWSRLRRREGSEAATNHLSFGLPLGVSYLITLGIPPLLFVQVLYGQQFYASSIIMGLFWIQVIGAIILAYLGMYIHKLTKESKPNWQPWIIAVALLLLLYVGFIYANNLTLSMQPAKWLELYAANPAGTVLNHGDPTAHFRFLFFLSPSLCVAGIWLLIFAAVKGQKDEQAEASYASRLGAGSFISGIVLMLIAGVLLLGRLQEDIMMMVYSNSASLIYSAIAVAGLLLSLVFALLSIKSNKKLFPILAAVAQFLGFAGVIMFRDLVRIEYLRPHFTLDSVTIYPQWGMFFFFLASMVAGLVFLLIVGLKVAKGKPQSA